jgi:hypothetical protein
MMGQANDGRKSIDGRESGENQDTYIDQLRIHGIFMYLYGSSSDLEFTILTLHLLLPSNSKI